MRFLAAIGIFFSKILIVYYAIASFTKNSILSLLRPGLLPNETMGNPKTYFGPGKPFFRKLLPWKFSANRLQKSLFRNSKPTLWKKVISKQLPTVDFRKKTLCQRFENFFGNWPKTRFVGPKIGFLDYPFFAQG